MAKEIAQLQKTQIIWAEVSTLTSGEYIINCDFKPRVIVGQAAVANIDGYGISNGLWASNGYAVTLADYYLNTVPRAIRAAGSLLRINGPSSGGELAIRIVSISDTSITLTFRQDVPFTADETITMQLLLIG